LEKKNIIASFISINGMVLLFIIGKTFVLGMPFEIGKELRTIIGFLVLSLILSVWTWINAKDKEIIGDAEKQTINRRAKFVSVLCFLYLLFGSVQSFKDTVYYQDHIISFYLVYTGLYFISNSFFNLFITNHALMKKKN
jgi:hypothetical protein